MNIAMQPTLRLAALAYKDGPFVYLDPDKHFFPSIELSEKLWTEYAALQQQSKQIILLSPSDISGVYPPEAHWLIPEKADAAWIRKHLAPLVATSTSFPPRDQTFFHTGDLGDIIACLPSIRALGGGHLIIGHKPDGQRESLKGERYEAIRPLLEVQPYLRSVRWADEIPLVDYDFSGFRVKPVHGENLARWQARHIGVQIDESPWLTTKEAFIADRKIIVARSGRYQEQAFPWTAFPWTAILHTHSKDCLFVGLPEEHQRFQKDFGYDIPFLPCGNLLDLANYLSGASLFIGNQSCPFWIAAGLGVPLIQETYRRYPNSIIERPNARYTRNDTELAALNACQDFREEARYDTGTIREADESPAPAILDSVRGQCVDSGSAATDLQSLIQELKRFCTAPRYTATVRKELRAVGLK